MQFSSDFVDLVPNYLVGDIATNNQTVLESSPQKPTRFTFINVLTFLNEYHHVFFVMTISDSINGFLQFYVLNGIHKILSYIRFTKIEL